MSLPKPDRQSSFFDVRFLVGELFPPNDRFRLFREKVMPALWETRPRLAELYCAENGREAIEPVTMAGMTLLQFIEKVPDRKACEQARLHLGWKFALDLEVHAAGCHPTSLVTFRERLVAGGAERVIFDKLVEVLAREGLLRKHGRRRLDSTHILGAVAEMSRLEAVRETLRLTLKALACQGVADGVPGWAALAERYLDSEVDWRQQTPADLRTKFGQAGLDLVGVVVWARAQGPGVWGSEALLLAERVLLEQYELDGPEPAQRKKEPPGAVQNPHDPEAQWSTKSTTKDKDWEGYKAQLEETVADDPTPKPKGEPTEQFLTDVVTTEATASDIDGMHRVQAGARERGEAPPPELLVDTAYVSGDTLAEARAEGRELVGPAHPSQEHKGVFASEAFDVDLAARCATCPAGKVSCQCSFTHDQHQGRSYYRFEWGRECEGCELRSRCTASQAGRRILAVGEHHDLVQARRREMCTEDFRHRVRQRAGIEGTISELKRSGMARTRYRGLRKTGLANLLVGAACNVNRWFRRLAWQTECAQAAV